MRPTPFHPRTSELCVSYNWTVWSGWLSANSYEPDHTHEYLAIRTACAVFDTSPLFKYDIHGPDAFRLVNRVVTQDVAPCIVGRCIYTPWCDDDGKIIDDGILFHLKDNLFRLTTADPTLYWLEDNAAGLDVVIEEVSESLAALALQGPYSRHLLKELSKADFGHLRPFAMLETKLADIPVTISRTGFAGDLGFEIWVEAHQAVKLWDLLFETGEAYRIRPFGEYALDMARIEAGLLLGGADFQSSKKVLHDFQKSSPYELGLGWAVKPNKEFFVGQGALKDELSQGPHFATVGLNIDLISLENIYNDFGMPLHLPYQSWTDAVPVYSGGRQIGKATSGTWSPILKKFIAIARLKARFAQLDTQVDMEVTVDAHRREARVRVVKLPFFNPPRRTSVVD